MTHHGLKAIPPKISNTKKLSFVKLFVFLDVNCAESVAVLFGEELVPVAPKAQKKVPVPEGYESLYFCLLRKVSCRALFSSSDGDRRMVRSLNPC